jgi:lipopolysaccharide transport protein LptA
MRTIFPALFLIALLGASPSRGQDSVRTPQPGPAAKPRATPASAATDTPITTQIYADEASFDTEKRIGIFSGHVRVFDPRFNIQSDKLTVYIHKDEGEGLEKAIAEGHVGVVREKPGEKGKAPSKSIGLSEKAVYTSSDGNVVLTGNPRVQQSLDTHVATSPETVMILNPDGRLTTHGPSRTDIRQEKKGNASPAAAAGASPAPSP